MPIIVREKWDSRERTKGEGSDPDSEDRIFFSRGTDDSIIAEDAAIAFAPNTVNGLDRRNTSTERIAEDIWMSTIRYGEENNSQTEVGGVSYQFDTGGGTQHITQALEQKNFPEPDAADYKDAIGVTSDGVEGVDIVVPVYNFGETHTFLDSFVPDTLRARLFFLTGTVNTALFRGFKTGEVLFLGASGSQRNKDEWEISYRFSAIPNLTNVTVAGFTGIDKGGHDYIWGRYQEEEDTNAKETVLRAQSIHVAKVYFRSDFNLLGIGTNGQFQIIDLLPKYVGSRLDIT